MEIDGGAVDRIGSQDPYTNSEGLCRSGGFRAPKRATSSGDTTSTDAEG
jgi:hypothetical protein